MTALDQDITDYAAAVFLRYFRKGIRAETEMPHLDRARDIALLRAHWAISKPVRDFLSYVLSHRHEAQSLLQINRKTDDAVARGRIDARSTILMRRVSGHPSVIVSEEPVRSFNTGPNQVVAWVVNMAANHVARLFALQQQGSAYTELIESAMSEIAAVKRLDSLREPLKHVATNRRPESGAIRDAARSRRMIYRYAIAAYNTLTGIEVGEEAALQRVLHSTLFAPLEQWRRFELAVAVGIGEVISEETGEEMRLSVIGNLQEQPIIQCGRFRIYWQSETSLFSNPPLEPSEIRLEAMLSAYGMHLSAGRPDLVIVDQEEGSVAAIVEVKYLAGDTAAERFQEAAAQIVRYARGYSNSASIDNLISRSLVALSMDAPKIIDCGAPTVRAIDFPAMRQGALRGWVKDRLLSLSH